MKSLRPRFHLTPPRGWMNDPNGFSHVNGTYRLYYQYHPLDGDTSHIGWRLATSKDLVDFVDRGVALTPSFAYEGVKDEYGGCWSGSAVKSNGRDALIYASASSRTGQSVSLAYLDEDLQAHQCENNPITLPPSGIRKDFFRDPYAFSYRGHDYFIIGASGEDGVGRILLYELLQERAIYKGVFHEDKEIGMFECPTLLFLGDMALLVASPLGLKRKGNSHQNKNNNVAILGHLDERACFVSDSGMIDLDKGFDYYAAQGIVDPHDQGKGILVAWLSLWDKDFNSIPTRFSDGYLGTMALPRTIEISGGGLVQKPVPAVYSHFQKGFERRLVEGDVLEVPSSYHLRFDGIKGDFAIDFYQNPHGSVRLSYDEDKWTLTLEIIDDRDKEKGRLYPPGKRVIELEHPLSGFEAFVDSYVLELFMNDGEKTASVMYYGNDGGSKVRLLVGGKGIHVSVSAFAGC